MVLFPSLWNDPSTFLARSLRVQFITTFPVQHFTFLTFDTIDRFAFVGVNVFLATAHGVIRDAVQRRARFVVEGYNATLRTRASCAYAIASLSFGVVEGASDTGLFNACRRVDEDVVGGARALGEGPVAGGGVEVADVAWFTSAGASARFGVQLVVLAGGTGPDCS